MSSTVKHAPSNQPHPAPWRHSFPDPLVALGLRIDYRTACAPWGSHNGAGEPRLFTVAVDAEGRADWSRVTCKRCRR